MHLCNSSSLHDFQHYTSYLSPNYSQSQLLRSCYPSSPQISLSIELANIIKWIQQSTHSKPLLITSTQHGGKKTLLCQLINHLQKSHTHFYIISQFASVTPYFAQLIYNITIQLRTHLSINQKVQLNQQKLRQYFKYWLQLSDSKIQKDYLSYQHHQKPKIILIIQGIDHIIDSKNIPIIPSFWLPDINLKNISIILTSTTSSKITQLVKSQVSSVIQYVLPEYKIKQLKQKLFHQTPIVKHLTQQTHINDLIILNKLLTSHPKFHLQQTNLNTQQFFIKFIQYLNHSYISQSYIYQIFSHLIWNKYGISKYIISKSTKIQPNIIDSFFTIFHPILLNTHQNYTINNYQIKSLLNNIILSKYTKYQNYKKSIHTSISKFLKKSSHTLPTLQQLIYHLQHSSNYTELQQLLTKIQNFLILYTPLTKHLLCICWFTLQTHYQYDPVFQYNRSLQKFVNHYFPSPQDTFRIIFQLALFFKQYSQFENSKTPTFRHPPIRGQIEHFQSISIYDQLQAMNMHQKSKLITKQTLQQSLGKASHKQPTKNTSIKQIQSTTLSQKYSQDNIESYQSISNTKQIEKLNINIKFHQNLFKNYYLASMKSYIQESYLQNTNYPVKQHNQQNNINQLDSDSDHSTSQLDLTKLNPSTLKKPTFFQSYNDFHQQSYHQTTFYQHTFYYYKQWLWVQFPWLCQSVTHNYSQLINKCMKNPTQYMPLNLQSKLIKEAIRISKMAKYNKNQYMENTIIQNNSIVTKNNKNNINRPIIQQFPYQRNSVPISPNSNKLSTSTPTQRFPTKQKNPSLKKQKLNINKQNQSFKHLSLKPSKSNINSNSIFMTDIQTLDKQNNNLQKLPHLLKNSSLSFSQLSKNTTINIIQTRNYNLLISKYDQLKYQNQQLLSHISTITQNRQTLQQNHKLLQKTHLQQTITSLITHKNALKKQTTQQLSLKTKLQLIIKLCNLNKNHNSVSTHLNNFLSSIKYMVNNQQNNIITNQTNFKKFLSTNKFQYKKLKQQKQSLLSKLTKYKIKQKNKLSKNLCNSNVSNSINKKEKCSIKKKNKFLSTNSKYIHKNPTINKQLLQLNTLINLIHQQLGLQYGQHHLNQSILSNHSDQLDKLNSLQWQLTQLMDSNTTTKSKLLALTQKISTNQDHKQHQKHQAKRTIQDTFNKNISNLQERIKCLETCFGILDQPIPHNK